MKYLRSVLLILLLIPLSSVTAQSPSYSTTQSPSYSTTEESQYLWRADLNQFPISDAQIHPRVGLTPNGSLSNLGLAKLTWTIPGDTGLIVAYATYDQGELSQVRTIDRIYDTITWFAIDDSLIGIGTLGNQTDLNIITDSGDFLRRTVSGITEDHHLFLSRTTFWLYANNTSLNQQYYYTLEGLSVRQRETNHTVLAAGVGGAVIKLPTGEKIFYSGPVSNQTLTGISDNVEIGHIGLNPVVYDMENQLVFNPSGQKSTFFPTNITNFHYYGLRSSIVGTNTTYYEIDRDNNWDEIGAFGTTPLDLAIVDIGLYLGPVVKAGLGLVMSGIDTDGDGIPDTMEDYYGSLSTQVDTDNDGLSDKSEILFGTDPAVNDIRLDYDNDGLNNENEIRSGLDPRNPDTDYGGAQDGWEVRYDYNASDPSDDGLDEDNDGVSNRIESEWNSNPRNTDTDGDKMPDAWEIEYTLDPDRANAQEDPDGDGLTNLEEYQLGTDPLVKNPKEWFEGLWLEFAILLSIGLPIGILLWRKIVLIEE